MLDFEIIGIDGGASKISGWQVLVDQETMTFSLSDNCITKEYRHCKGFDENFKPLSLNIQLEEMSGEKMLTDKEKSQGEVFMNACAELISEFHKKLNGRKLLVGIGMPGLKSKDKRGIVALANGPRMPDYLSIVENKLNNKGVELLAPVSALGSDADYCGLGEEYAENGLFRYCSNAYYLGGGTGVADAVKLNNEVIPFDNLNEWIAKTWEMAADDNLSLERFTSASGIQFLYSRHRGIPLAQLNEAGIFPAQILKLALDNDTCALSTMTDAGRYLARLFYERITTFYFGWTSHFRFISPDKKPLKSRHPYAGTLLERIIIGQRLGELVCRSKDTRVLYPDIIDELTRLIAMTDDPVFRAHYLEGGALRKDLIRSSKLREAPALGAGIDAFISKFN